MSKFSLITRGDMSIITCFVSLSIKSGLTYRQTPNVKLLVKPRGTRLVHLTFMVKIWRFSLNDELVNKYFQWHTFMHLLQRYKNILITLVGYKILLPVLGEPLPHYFNPVLWIAKSTGFDGKPEDS